MNNRKDERYFRISSFYAAAFLFAKGLELVNIDNFQKGRSVFVFRDTPEREAYLQAFNFASEDAPDSLIDARKFVMSIKMLKDKLYQQRSQQ